MEQNELGMNLSNSTVHLNGSLSFSRRKELKKLYKSAFPKSERKPFSLMRKKEKEGCMEILSIENEDGAFLGLVIMILHGDIALLDYFAVAPNQRGHGIGSKVLAALKERYNGKRILLEIEDPDEPADNTEERKRRHAFYLRNGMKVMDYKVWLFGIKMLILTSGEDVSFEEYNRIFGEVFAPSVAKMVTLAQ